jgi:bifunctional non-homologous end joining protein LigD
MSLRLHTRSTLRFIEPCLPSPAKRPPAGPDWIHEIKHDGFRIMARRDGASVRLITRHGNDFTSRFPLAAAAVMALPGRSFMIDGEAIVTNASGLAVFDLIRRKRHGGDAVLIAFDLIELDGEDLRRSPIEHRKRKLAKLARSPHPGIVLNEVFEGDGHILTSLLRPHDAPLALLGS